MEKNIIKKSWREVTINEYFDLVEKLENEVNEPIDEAIIKIAFVHNLNNNDVWNLNFNELVEYQNRTLWLNEFKINENVKFNSIEINGQKYIIDCNLTNFTVAQYIDFQTLYPKRNTNRRILGNLLACFIIPKGKKYADGYDVNELANTINCNLDIMTAEEIMFFFLKNYLISIRATANYFNWILKKATKRMKDKDKAKELIQSWETIKTHTLNGLRSLTM